MQKSEIIRNNIAETSNNNDQNKQKQKNQNLIIYFKIKLHNKIENQIELFKQSMNMGINHYIEQLKPLEYDKNKKMQVEYIHNNKIRQLRVRF